MEEQVELTLDFGAHRGLAGVGYSLLGLFQSESNQSLRQKKKGDLLLTTRAWGPASEGHANCW